MVDDDYNNFFSSGKNLGIIIGFILGICLVLFGWGKTLVLAVTTGIGFLIGKFYDERDFDVELEEADDFIMPTQKEKIEENQEEEIKNIQQGEE